MLFLMFHMIWNYARYGIDGPASRGFLPPTLEEVISCLLRGEKGRAVSPIEPINISTTHNLELRPEPEMDLQRRPQRIRTHKPWGKAVFRALGFLETEEQLNHISPDERHHEFPFSASVPSSDYPKFKVADSLVPASVGKKLKFLQRKKKLHLPQHLPNHAAEQQDPLSTFNSDSFEEDSGGGCEVDLSAGMTEISSTNSSETHERCAKNLHVTIEAAEAPLPAYKRIPEQSMDVKKAGSKKLPAVLEDVEDQMHKFTRYMFKHTTHVVRNPDAAYFTQGRLTKGSNGKLRRLNGDVQQHRAVSKELDRLLQVKEYSQVANPVASKLAELLNPMISGGRSFICLVRAIFNASTFQDPFLSFWVFVFGGITTVILFVFPWRIFFFIIGCVAVGPQNWFIRKRKERQGKKEPVKKEEGDSPSLSVNSFSLPEDQPLFKSHCVPNAKHREIDRSTVDTRRVHEVVVPYSPLMHSRFYDWPPEAEYARVAAAPNTSTQ